VVSAASKHSTPLTGSLRQPGDVPERGALSTGTRPAVTTLAKTRRPAPALDPQFL